MYSKLYKNFKQALFLTLLANLAIVIPTWIISNLSFYFKNLSVELGQDLIAIVLLNVAFISMATAAIFIFTDDK